MTNKEGDIERSIYALCTDESDGFVHLTKIVGLDPEKDFIGEDLRGCDFSNQDMRLYNLEGADLTGCRFYKTIFECFISCSFR